MLERWGGVKEGLHGERGNSVSVGTGAHDRFPNYKMSKNIQNVKPIPRTKRGVSGT